MNKLLIITVLLLTCFTGIAQKVKTVTITGNVSGDTKGYNKVYYFSGSAPQDSVLISDGKFVVRVPFSATHTLGFMTQYAQVVKRSYQTLSLLIDGSGDVQIEMDIDKGFSNAKISGSPTAVSYFNFRSAQASVDKKVDDDLDILYGRSYVSQKDTLYKRLFTSRDSLYKLYLGALMTDFVLAHKNEFLGVFVLSSVGRNVFSIEKYGEMLQSLSPEIQKTPEGEKIAAYLRGVKNTKIGATVKNFVLNNPEGKPVSFEQFKGKYVWIDFWASWCVPCKKAFPHMKELYTAYKEKGLEILGISTDSKIEPWLNILPVLQNPWTQVWDSKNIMSEFAVTAFPTSFLIDPNGVIVLKEVGYNPGGESPLEKKLTELFGAYSNAAQTAVTTVPLSKSR